MQLHRSHPLLAAAALALTLSACGGTSDAGGDSSDADWSGAKLAPVEVDVKGQKVTVSLPEGMELESGPLIKYVPKTRPRLSLPTFSFRLETSAPKGVEDLKLSSGTAKKPMTVTRQEAVAGGLLIAGHNDTKGTVELVFWRLRDDKSGVSCRAVQARELGVPNPEATLAMFERACTSMQLN